MNKNKGIDITKFICAIFIACVYHYLNDFPMGNLIKNNNILRIMAEYGYLLVELFFIISGYLFYKSYNKKIKNKKINFTTFIKKRYSRLIPLAALTSFVMFILESIYFKINNCYWLLSNNNIVSLVLQMTGIQFWTNIRESSLNNVIWYISVLLLCYIVYFYLSLHSKKRGNVIYLCGVIVFIILMTYNINIPLINGYTLRGLTAFGIGILVALLTEKKDIKTISNISIIVLLLTLIATVLLKREVMGNLLLYLDIIVYPCILINIIRFEFIFDKIDSIITDFLSNISFGIYLWNLPLQLFFYMIFSCFNVNINYGSTYFFILQIIIQLLFATFSYKVIEKYLKNFEIYITKKLKK